MDPEQLNISNTRRYKKGEVNRGPWFGKKRPPFSEEWKQKIREANYRRKERDGYINSPEARKKLSLSLRGKPKSKEYREKIRGENSPFWRGGIAKRTKLLRERAEYKEWRRAVFERDNYTCQICGQRGGILNADHKIPFCVLPESMYYELTNGQTLCISCHKKSWSYGQGAANFRKELRIVYPSS